MTTFLMVVDSLIWMHSGPLVLRLVGWL